MRRVSGRAQCESELLGIEPDGHDRLFGCAPFLLCRYHDFILQLPQGYNTLLHEEGLRLSGGQRQRIALARALLMKADLLILDEATSELDAITEQAIRQTIREYAGERGVLLVAHRLSNVVQADRIYVMKKGRIIEEGTHLELVQNNESYAQMIEAQKV